MSQKILIVEDEVNIAETLEDLLELQGYDIKIATDGESGFFSAIREHPDLILCDVMMPGMDGYELLEALRGYDKTRQIPFIFLTASGKPQDFRNGMNLGADDYLTKPVENTVLVSTIKNKLKKYNDLIETGHLSENKRVSQELHDTLQQTLLGLKMKMDRVRDIHGKCPEVEGAASYIKTALAQLRLIIEGNFDALDSQTAFVDRLNGIINKLKDYVTFQLKLINNWKTEFPMNKTSELLKVLYEIFNNEVKHAQSKNVILLLTEDEVTFKLSVTDDGTGIDPTKFKEGRGFTGMRERLVSIGGSFDFQNLSPGLEILITIKK